MKQKKVRLAIIGTGAWSGAIGNAMVKSERVKLVTCFDPIVSKREAFSLKFGCDQEKSLEDVLARDDVEGIHLTTPNALHAEQALLAARYGKHVFVDKPIANTIADAKKMIAACSDAGVVLMVGQHLRRLAGFRKSRNCCRPAPLGISSRWTPIFPRTWGLP